MGSWWQFGNTDQGWPLMSPQKHGMAWHDSGETGGNQFDATVLALHRRNSGIPAASHQWLGTDLGISSFQGSIRSLLTCFLVSSSEPENSNQNYVPFWISAMTEIAVNGLMNGTIYRKPWFYDQMWGVPVDFPIQLWEFNPHHPYPVWDICQQFPPKIPYQLKCRSISGMEPTAHIL